jgi:hypothetical protein
MNSKFHSLSTPNPSQSIYQSLTRLFFTNAKMLLVIIYGLIMLSILSNSRVHCNTVANKATRTLDIRPCPDAPKKHTNTKQCFYGSSKYD